MNDVPKNADLYKNYVRKTVAHFRRMGVTHFGIWNEPNLSYFWEGTKPELVNLIFVPGFQGIKEGCRDAGHDDCLILGPEMAHIKDYDVWMEHVLKALKKQNLIFDIIAHHNYHSFGREIWDGDSFVNALDQRRSSFTRRSLMDVLNDSGYTNNGVPIVDVWITEVGYQIKSANKMDRSAMQKQSDYIQNVIDAQLKRSWYTNSLFYQLRDSHDVLDGFGIARGDSRESDTNFQLKTAFHELKNRIQTDDRLEDARK